MDVMDFPTACPKCQATTGFPRMTTGGLMTGEIRCSSCGYEWVAFTPSPPIIAKKKDRRQAARDTP
jgi:transposase-like protein